MAAEQKIVTVSAEQHSAETMCEIMLLGCLGWFDWARSLEEQIKAHRRDALTAVLEGDG
jgi:hypothetical protein